MSRKIIEIIIEFGGTWSLVFSYGWFCYRPSQPRDYKDHLPVIVNSIFFQFKTVAEVTKWLSTEKNIPSQPPPEGIPCHSIHHNHLILTARNETLSTRVSLQPTMLHCSHLRLEPAIVMMRTGESQPPCLLSPDSSLCVMSLSSFPKARSSVATEDGKLMGREIDK